MPNPIQKLSEIRHKGSGIFQPFFYGLFPCPFVCPEYSRTLGDL